MAEQLKEKKAGVQFRVRLAAAADADYIRLDRGVAPELVKRKIDLQEAFVVDGPWGPIGFMLIDYLWSSTPLIAILYVHPDYRRQGIGRAMVDHLKDFLRDRAYTVLYSSAAMNEPELHAWHRHIGFSECGILCGINEGVGQVFFCTGL